MSDDFTSDDTVPASGGVTSNIPEYTVSEIATGVKKTLEEAYGRVRVRGELSRVKFHTSGHFYSDLKDENAVLNLVCWRSRVGKLAITPEEGLEVICTGRISSYPARSNYQLVVESMDLAGEGALLKMLEERRKKLAGEGLFDDARKRAIPYLPTTIGIVTSPTGAVIRDMLHRLEDRFPRHVLVHGVRVQGESASGQIIDAIRRFNTLVPDGDPPRPDVLIVARGGGSLEDLMAFNDEALVRAVAASDIPVISAVGHETDTTLIDYAADLRAPTPTGAAEKVVPVRMDLLAGVQEYARRLYYGMRRLIRDMHNRLQARAAKLGEPASLLEMRMQRLDEFEGRLYRGFTATITNKQARLSEVAARVGHPQDRIDERYRMLGYYADRLTALGPRLPEKPRERLNYLAGLLESYSYTSVLKRGFALVRDSDGAPVTAAAQTRAGQQVRIQFHDDNREAVIGGGAKKGRGSTTKHKSGSDDEQERLL
jgi:exodeoxyribonuclease VII large subunit